MEAGVDRNIFRKRITNSKSATNRSWRMELSNTMYEVFVSNIVPNRQILIDE
jgi:hypothetical protein